MLRCGVGGPARLRPLRLMKAATLRCWWSSASTTSTSC